MNAAPIIIPAYEPSQSLLALVDALIRRIPVVDILVVNDGSGEKSRPIFSALALRPQVHLLEHEKNRGKGAALKTAFAYYLAHQGSGCLGVVTADADGQHTPEDIERVRNKLLTEPHALILGIRTFDQEEVPFRSRFGNKLTRYVFRLAAHQDVHDTQTGLRGIPTDLLEDMLSVEAEGYEFELEMLMMAAEYRVPMLELPIHTVYIDHNAASHFRPVLDSVKIYFVFLRFVAVSLCSFLLDFALFSLVYWFWQKIGWAVLVARFVSGIFNFKLNRHIAFRSQEHQGIAFVKYAALATLLALAGYAIIWYSHHFVGMNVYLAKIMAELLLYLVSFLIQRLFIFRRQFS